MNFGDLSKQLERFNEFYQIELAPQFKKLQKRSVVAELVFLGVVVLVMVGFGVSLTITSEENWHLFLVFALGAGVIMFSYDRVKKVRTDAKLVVLPILCEKLGIEYSATPDEKLTEEFEKLRLVPKHNLRTIEDQMSGILGRTDFLLQDAKLASKNTKSKVTVFTGLLCCFDFHREFDGITIGIRDSSEFSTFFSDPDVPGERVSLADTSFENRFEVFSTDQNAALSLLSPKLMESILKLRSHENIQKIQFAFKNGKLYLALDSHKLFFEGGHHRLDDPAYVENIVSDIALVFDVVRTLNFSQETKD